MNTPCSETGQRQTTIHNYETSTMWGNQGEKEKKTPQKSSTLIMGLEAVTGPKILLV
jgi:hypothetical protein